MKGCGRSPIATPAARRAGAPRGHGPREGGTRRGGLAARLVAALLLSPAATGAALAAEPVDTLERWRRRLYREGLVDVSARTYRNSCTVTSAGQWNRATATDTPAPREV